MLPFSISLRSGVPIHDQVVYAVTRAVVARQLSPGDPFPSVRALSQELRINPNTAHRIVATLIGEGLLSVRPGIGTVVNDTAGMGRRRLPEEDVERFVVLARRAGLSLPETLKAVRKHWARSAARQTSRGSGTAVRQAE